MPFGVPPITDFCFLIEDAERSVAFYRDKLGFKLRTRAEGFADFTTRNVALALWEIDHIARTIGISNKRSGPGVHKAVAAMELARPDEVDELYDRRIVDALRAAFGAMWAFDIHVIDGLANRIGWVAALGGGALRRAQTGIVGNYALTIVAGLLVILVAYGGYAVGIFTR